MAGWRAGAMMRSLLTPSGRTCGTKPWGEAATASRRAAGVPGRGRAGGRGGGWGGGGGGGGGGVGAGGGGAGGGGWGRRGGGGGPAGGGAGGARWGRRAAWGGMGARSEMRWMMGGMTVSAGSWGVPG